jgi:hypothetical protein
VNPLESVERNFANAARGGTRAQIQRLKAHHQDRTSGMPEQAAEK